MLGYFDLSRVIMAARHQRRRMTSAPHLWHGRTCYTLFTTTYYYYALKENLLIDLSARTWAYIEQLSNNNLFHDTDTIDVVEENENQSANKDVGKKLRNQNPIARYIYNAML